MTRLESTALLLALAACATGGGARPGGAPDAPAASAARGSGASAAAIPDARAPGAPAAPAGGAPSAPAAAAPAAKGPAPAPARELSPRARRLWDEAVAAQAEFAKLRVATDWEVVERRWRAVTEAEPVPEAFHNLGVALQQRGRADEARAAYRRALELEPALAPSAVNLALLDEPKDPRAAAEAWAGVLRRHPQEALPRARLAALYADAGQLDEAWRLGREALVRDPRSVAAYKVLLRVALARGNVDLAHLLAVKAQKLDPGDAEIVAAVGDALWKAKDEPGAVAQWNRALALRPDLLPPRYALLRLALAKQHWEGVAEGARKILAVRSDDPQVHLALGVALRYLGKPDEALAAYDAADKAAAGKLPEVHLAKGVLLMKAKDRCEPALVELKRYVLDAGPGVASEGPAMRLERECMEILAANRQAEEAAREMKAEAERQAAKKAAPAPAAPPASPGAKPASSTGGGAQPQPLPPAPAAGSRPGGMPAAAAASVGGETTSR